MEHNGSGITAVKNTPKNKYEFFIVGYTMLAEVKFNLLSDGIK